MAAAISATARSASSFRSSAAIVSLQRTRNPPSFGTKAGLRGTTRVPSPKRFALAPRSKEDAWSKRYRASPGPALLPVGSGANSRAACATGSQLDAGLSVAPRVAVLVSVSALWRLARGLAGFLRGQINVVPEYFGIADGHVREDLAVDVDPRETQRFHQPTVRNARLPRGGVYASDPERAKLPLARAPVAICVTQRVHCRLARRT